jgi:hypothetical protein
MILISVFSIAIVSASDPRATKLMELDKASCSSAASQAHTWLLHMTEWRESYNNCLRGKLKALAPRYIRSSLEAIRLESLCPESTLNGTPIDLSIMGIHIANGLTAREMQKSATSNTLEQTLELYYDKTIKSNLRIRQLRN